MTKHTYKKLKTNKKLLIRQLSTIFLLFQHKLLFTTQFRPIFYKFRRFCLLFLTKCQLRIILMDISSDQQSDVIARLCSVAICCHSL